MSPKDKGTHRGAGMRGHRDIGETVAGWGRKHCRYKDIWGKLRPMLVRLTVAMGVIGRL